MQNYTRPLLASRTFTKTIYFRLSSLNRFTQSLDLPSKSKPQISSIIRQFLRLSFPRSRQEDVLGASVRCAEQDDLFKEIAPFEYCSKPEMFKQSPGVFSLMFTNTSALLRRPLSHWDKKKWPFSARSAIRKRAMLSWVYDVILLCVQLDPALYVVHGHFLNRVMAARRSSTSRLK